MEPAASPSPSLTCIDSGHLKSQLAWIELFVFLTFILLFCLYLVGIFRRGRRSTVLKVFALVGNAAILSLIPYLFGLMRNLGHKGDLVSVWAVYLMYVYANVPNFVSFNDSLSLGVAFVKLYLYTYYIGVIIYSSYTRAISESYKHIIPPRGLPRLQSVVGGFALLRALEIIISRAFLVKRRVYNLTDYRNINRSVVPSLPTSSTEDPWLRCNYAFHSVYNFDRAPNTSRSTDFPIQKIWSIEEAAGCILSSSWELKSYCLSLSLFWKLVPMFRGRRPFQSSSDREEAWNLVRNGLLDKSICGNRYPFRVIEVELALLHDYIYNSSCFVLCNLEVPSVLALHMLRLGGIIWIGVSTLQWYHAIHPLDNGLDVLLTWMVVIISSVLELVQFIHFWSSRWPKMLLLCTYLVRESWEEQNLWDLCIRKATEKIHCPTRGGGDGGSELSKPWQKLGQYSLLDKCHGLSFLSLLIRLFIAKKESKSVSLTNEIKDAVINTLLHRGPQLTNGIATLEASNQLSPETKGNLVWACTQVYTKTRVVLIWHIATSLCEIDELKRKGSPDPSDDDFNVATSLSKYCAYLVAFAPDLLPGNVANTQYTCSEVIVEASDRLEDCEIPTIIYDELMKIAVEYDDPSKRSAASILEQGAVLGKVLVEQVEDPEVRWKVLAEFWAEMILYLAPNENNEWAHVERLADGGEFITHLWALLFHAGFVDRDSLSNHPARDADANHPSEFGQV